MKLVQINNKYWFNTNYIIRVVSLNNGGTEIATLDGKYISVNKPIDEVIKLLNNELLL